MTKKLLTELAIKKLPHADGAQITYWDKHLGGFGVKIGARAKSYVVKHQNRVTTLGRYGEISLADARKAAMRVLSDENQAKRAPSLSVALTAYLKECDQKNKPSTVKEYRRLLRDFKDKPVNEVSRKDLPPPTRHGIMAWRIFFNWCIRHEYIEKNPFAHERVRYGQRDRVLSDDELKILWEYDHEPFTTILKLLLLTGQRRSQIWKLQPDWIDGDLVTFPAEVMKGNRPHTMPLGPWAEELAAEAPFDFNCWSKCKYWIDKNTGITDWTIHDLRRTHSTIAARIGIPIHVEEKILDHRTGTISGVAAVYNRHSYIEEMREAVLQYEKHLASIIGP